MERMTKTLIRLRGCAGWSASLLFAYGISRFCHDAAQSYLVAFQRKKKKTTGQITIRYIITTTLISGADPGFLDRGFKLAEGGGGFDLCSLTNFSWNSPWKWNNVGSRWGSFEPPEPPLNPPLHFSLFRFLSFVSRKTRCKDKNSNG